MAHGVVRTDNMHGIDVGVDLVAVKYYDGTAYAKIDNGNVVALDSYLNGDVWKAVKPTANQAIGKLALIAAPEIFKDYEHPFDQFENEAGAVVRGYLLRAGDIFSVTVDALEGTPDLTTNKYVKAQAKTQLLVADAATNAVAELIAVDPVGDYTYYVFRVL